MAKEDQIAESSKGKGKEPVKDGADGVAGAEKGKDGKDKKDDLELAPGQCPPILNVGCTTDLFVEELSEEDQKLKDELDMLVERITV